MPGVAVGQVGDLGIVMTANSRMKKTYWLSYGGGVNSTALAILLVNGKLPQYEPFRFVFADTQDEEDATYEYIYREFMPWLRARGHCLEVCCDCEGVLERWERLGVTGSRLLRSCSVEAKINPVRRHIDAHGTDHDEQLIGIAAEESGRANNARGNDRPRRYPLVALDIDRDGCVQVIRDAGLPVPPKSGCWHCPFKRVGQVLELVVLNPCRFERIARLEQRATELHPTEDGSPRHHWGDKTCDQWRDRANGKREGGDGLFDDELDDLTPCACID